MIIAFTGPAGCGKDTAADYLAAYHGFERLAFADPIREMLGALGLGPEDFERPQKERDLDWLPASPRKLAQTLGTEWGRDIIDPDIWVRALARRIAGLPSGSRVAISDCRFDNEARWVRHCGGLVVHLTRPDLPTIRPHASERGIEREEHDLLLDNAGPVRELFWTLDALVHNNDPETALGHMVTEKTS